MLLLNYRDFKPIPQQVEDEIKRLIVAGAFVSGDKIYSIAEMSSKLAINPNIIEKVYNDLCHEGILCKIGDGDFCIADEKILYELKIKMLLEEFDELTEELLRLDSSDEAISMLKKRIDKREKGAQGYDRG